MFCHDWGLSCQYYLQTQNYLYVVWLVKCMVSGVMWSNAHIKIIWITQKYISMFANCLTLLPFRLMDIIVYKHNIPDFSIPVYCSITTYLHWPLGVVAQSSGLTVHQHQQPETAVSLCPSATGSNHSCHSGTASTPLQHSQNSCTGKHMHHTLVNNNLA